MGQIWVRAFSGGLDTRKMPETTAGGNLIRAFDCHINRGGEIEQRAAFVPVYNLPGATFGMTAGSNGLTVFGSAPPPALPSGVSYQRLQVPNGSLLTKVLSTCRYASLLYTVGLFSDGKIYHFYNGEMVADWYDQQARASFVVTSGTPASGTKSAGTLTLTAYPSYGGANSLMVQVNGVDIMSAPLTYTPSVNPPANIVAALANAIASYSATSGYTAVVHSTGGYSIDLTATAAGTAANGKAITTVESGSPCTFTSTAFAGGAADTQPTLTSLKIGTTETLTAPITWTGDPATMAAAIAAGIGGAYTASAKDTKVSIVAPVDPLEFGKAVTFTKTGTLVLSPATGLTMTTGGSFEPGSYVTTIGSKIYTVSGSTLHFSGIKEPTKFQTETTGAGFIDMASESSGSEKLQAVAKYQSYIAVFGEETTLIFYVDADPTLNKQSQVLNNTGTVSGRSVAQFGDSDLFYCDESGIRSLRARDASNAAATSDIGVPVDTLVIEKLAGMTDAERAEIKSCIEPKDGRYWLVLKDEIFVFSYFPGSKVSAWSIYRPTIVDGGATQTLTIDDLTVYNRKVYVRSGDTLYCFGGLDASPEYDATIPEVWLPYLDGDAPTRVKHLTGLDIACEGEWEISLGMQPTDLTASDLIGIVTETTFSGDTFPAEAAATHFSIRLRGINGGPHKVAAAVLHYRSDDNED